MQNKMVQVLANRIVFDIIPNRNLSIFGFIDRFHFVSEMNPNERNIINDIPLSIETYLSTSKLHATHGHGDWLLSETHVHKNNGYS